MTKEEYAEIVKRFNEDKVKYDWIALLKAYKNFTTEVYNKRVLPKQDYYKFKNGKEFKYWLLHSEEEDFIDRRFCPICGTFITKITKKPWFYSKACCYEHARLLAHDNIIKTNVLKYGGKSPMCDKNIQNKVINNWKNKSKEEILEHNIKIKTTKFECHGDENYNNREQYKQTCLKKYGTENILCEGTAVRDKINQENLEKYGNVSPMANPKTREKAKQTNLKKYDVEYPLQNKEILDKALNNLYTKYDGVGMGSETIREKIENTNILKYNTKTPIKNNKVSNKMKDSNNIKYGVDYPLQNSEIHTKSIESSLINESFGEERTQKIKNTLLTRYGDANYNNKEQAIQTKSNWTKEQKDNFVTKIIDTKKQNSTLNTSKSFEDILIQYLIDTYPQYTIIRQYSDERYPFCCDCYIKELDLFIEFQGSYFHNWREFNNSIQHIKEYEEMVACGGLKANIANVWRYKDPKKRELAKKNNLNYLEYWERLLILPEDILDIDNNYVLYYQQKPFYKINRECLYDPIERWKYYKNAVKYSDFYAKYKYVKHLTLLKRPYITKQIGYSSFNIKLCEIINKDNIVYDPCGGWGHRLLGFKNHKGYIYNDINTEVFNNCKRMCKDLNINNTIFYNQDGALPIENTYDVVFTCPPYFNKEIFTDIGAENYSKTEFINWWNMVLTNLHPTSKKVYIVINSNYLDLFIHNEYKWKTITSHLRKSHYHKDTKKSTEIIVEYTLS